MYRRLSIAVMFVIACCSIQLTLFAVSASAGATVSFVKSDTTTKGDWQSSYGADGYYIANSLSSAPNYGSFAPQNQLDYTWAAATSDPRALNVPGSSSAIASAWYSPAPFGLAVTFNDQATHQVAFYALDWDSEGRTETFQVTDATSGQILDTRTVSNFANGTYLVWDISGNVVINMTYTAGSNAAVSGVFFGTGNGSGNGGGNPETVSISPQTIGLAANGTEQFTATVTNGSSQSVSWSIASVSPSGAAPGNFSATTSGLYIAPSSITGTETVTVKATTADQAASATATVSLSSGSSANFVGTDGLTQGSWQGTYGSDGYALAGSAQSLPGYATFNVENAQVYTWVPNTSDPRALQIPNSSGGIAAAWYSSHFSVPPTFSLAVDFTDGQTHQIALYALDWDGQGRAETIQIVDANTNAQLDSRVVSNFTGGEYLIWNVSGNVVINVTETVGPNCVISGVFFGASNGSAINVSVSPYTVFLSGSEQQQFAASVTGTATPNIAWSVSPSGSGSISSAGLYQAPAQPSNGQTVTITATQQNAAKPGTATVNLTTGGVANFLATDSTTQGAWQGTYGSDGYALATLPANPPSYGSYTVQNDSLFTWVPQTDDPRALQIPGGSGGIASTWYAIPTFSFNVDFTDGKLHQFALYAVDWDAAGRVETIQIVDASSNRVLDTRTLTNFANGTYLIWNVSGNVIVNVTWSSGPNAVVSGLFFGGGNSSSVTVSPSTVSLSASQTQQFSASVGGPNKTVTWSVTGGGSISSSGLYQAPSAIGSATTATVTATGANGVFGTASVLLTAGATASFAGTDTTTEGAWQTKYGSAGYSIAGLSQQLPANTTFTVANNNGTWVWNGSTTDPRALQIPGGTPGLGFASCWYKNHESFALGFNFADGNTHKVTLYAVDWDSTGRSESVVVLDANTGKVLDTEQLSNFVNGVYISWNITGSVTINVTVNSGANGVISGAFFQ